MGRCTESGAHGRALELRSTVFSLRPERPKGRLVVWKPVLSLASIPQILPHSQLSSLSSTFLFVCLFSKSSFAPLESMCSMERA